MKLIINGSNFGNAKIESSNFSQDVFKFKETKNTGYFINKYLDKVCDIDLIFKDEIIVYRGHICGGGQDTASIDRQSAKRSIKLI